MDLTCEWEKIVREKYADIADDWTNQPQAKEWKLKTTFEKQMALENRPQEYVITENIFRNFEGLWNMLSDDSRERFNKLRELSPTLREHTRCAELLAKVSDTRRTDNMENEIAGLKCYGKVFKLASLTSRWESCIENCMGNYRRCKQEKEDLQKAIAKQHSLIDSLFTDISTIQVHDICTKEVARLGFTLDKKFKVAAACAGPKICPALFRQLRECYVQNGMTTRPCEEFIKPYVACYLDSQYRPSERFYTKLDKIPNCSIPHPAVVKLLKEHEKNNNLNQSASS